jgi:hypothetical protein
VNLKLVLLCLACAAVAPFWWHPLLWADPLFLLTVYLILRSDDYAEERARVRREHWDEADLLLEERRRLLEPRGRE